ncbi:hypothetical protein [Pseudomonas amygdali]|uniref:hypothetical protein n=1 Tax=Pseudomonas amygdali TaxID=47877 RepID=UPI0005C92121|nr:hypothetical protein [Pseudomonas amygdali]KWS74874.1 hypothetical protein AL051_11285 [Pseudomonas amygdali pv. dendropanacis]
MSNYLTEEQMRAALFGTPVSKPAEPIASESLAAPVHVEPPASPSRSKAKAPVVPSKRKSLYPKIRVTLHVTKIYEGDVDVFIHDSGNLSTLVAQQEAKVAAQKKGYKYIEVHSVEQV